MRAHTTAIPVETSCKDSASSLSPLNCVTTARLYLIAGIVLTTACAMPKSETTPRIDVASESAKLLQRDTEWSALASQGTDTDRVASYWSDDAVLMMPGQAIIKGRAAIRDYVASSFKTPGFKIHWVSDAPTFSPDGKFAYMTGKSEVNVPGKDGKPMTIAMRGLTVWRVDPDGQWRCIADVATA